LSLTNLSTAPGGRDAPFAAYQRDDEVAAAPEAITPFIKRLRVRFNFTIYIRLHFLICSKAAENIKYKNSKNSIDNDSHLHYYAYTTSSSLKILDIEYRPVSQ
jgi:hypothetical protein